MTRIVPVSLRPIVSKVGLFKDWPLILIDLYTHEGIVGRSYLEPYLKSAARYIIPALHDLAEAQQNQALAPVDSFQTNRRSLNLIGYEGVAMIAAAGLDMAIWDALAKAADLPLAVLLGGTIGPVPAYNSNGLWLADVATLASEASELVSIVKCLYVTLLGFGLCSAGPANCIEGGESNFWSKAHTTSRNFRL